VGSTLAFGFIGHWFESHFISYHTESAFSKLISPTKCSLDDSVDYCSSLGKLTSGKVNRVATVPVVVLRGNTAEQKKFCLYTGIGGM